MPFGNGAKPELSYAGAAAPSNLMSFSLASETGYDDNILNVSQPRVGGAFVALGPRVEVLRQSAHLGVDLNYYPYYLFYPGQPYDRFNQSLSLDVSYKLSPSTTLQVRDSFSRQTGSFQPGLSSSVSVPELGPPTTLNQTVYTGFAPQQDNAVRVDAIYRKSSRTSITLFGAFDQLRFLGQPANGQQLLNTKGTTGGTQYAYRLSEHTSLGLLYLYQDFTFERSQSLIGAQSGVVTHSALASLAWQLAPSVAISVFGGPQYVPSQHYFVQSPALPGGTGGLMSPAFPARWDVAAGGTLTKKGEKNALNLTAQRMVTNGGGLLAAATNSSVGIGAGRKLQRRWDAGLNLSLARTDALNFASLPRNQISSQTASFSLDHPLSESVSARLAYTFIRQSNGGVIPVLASFHCNRVSLTFNYRAKSISLGR
jgi:hypothetical protein